MSLEKIVNVITDGRIDRLNHFCNIINIVYKYRYVVNIESTVVEEVDNYVNDNNLKPLPYEYISLLIKLLTKLYPNTSKKMYATVGGKIKEVLPTINVASDGKLFIDLTYKPNIVFEILDYHISDTFIKIDLRSDFINYIKIFGMHVSDETMNSVIYNFRVQIELVISGLGLPKILPLHREIETYIENLMLNKFKDMAFNGWVSDLQFIASPL